MTGRGLLRDLLVAAVLAVVGVFVELLRRDSSPSE